MDDEAKTLLREIRDLQREQLELTRKIYSGVPPWLNWRFSLRQVLIAVTVVAVVLGTLVMINR
ncbi:hypothetical protein [Lacipirellula sp.]|uniref:hypothetical protein n=1 Tax=Lacipirellula sp. TaxID=2691419 RepID=UPI003D0BDBC0